MQITLNIRAESLDRYARLIYNRFSGLDLSLPKNQNKDLTTTPIQADILTNKGRLAQTVKLTIGTHNGYLSVHTQIKDQKTNEITNFDEIITQALPNVQSPRANSEVRETIILSILDAIEKSIVFAASPKVAGRIKDDTKLFIARNSPIQVLTELQQDNMGDQIILKLPVEDAVARIEEAKMTGENPFPEVKEGDVDDHVLVFVEPGREVHILRKTA